MVSPSLLSLLSVKQVARRFTIPGVQRRIEVRLRASSLLNLNIIVHVPGKFADLKFTVFAISKQASIDTHALHNEVTLVWGSLRLAPINCAQGTNPIHPW